MKKALIMGLGIMPQGSGVSAARFLAERGYKVWLGGNIGVSPLNFASRIKKGNIIVLELSSFQLHDLKNPGFKVGVITNSYPDHLNFYADLDDYWEDKAKISGGAGFLVLGKNLPKMRKEGKVVYFRKSKFKDHKLVGEHNQENIGCAWEVGKIFKVPETKIKQAVRQFKGVPQRLEFIRELRGVKFYNDTTATHPKATVVALKSFSKKKIILFSPGLTWLPRINEFKRGEEFVKLVKDQDWLK